MLVPPVSPVVSPPPITAVPRASTLPLTAEKEEQQRAAVIQEAKSWVRTPYRQLADVRGGGVDCAMLLVRCWVDAGVFEPFDPRPYPPEWHLHRSEERYLAWMEAMADETNDPKPGDIAVFKFGMCYSHGGIIVGPNMLVHAFVRNQSCEYTELTDPALTWVGRDKRPRKYFDVWARLRRVGGAS